MSRAAIYWGIDFSDYPEPTCKGEGSFIGLKYARGAESLANYFIKKFGIKNRQLFLVQRDTKKANSTKTKLSGKKGIIFFRNISGFRGGVGDHIDLWNGTKTTGGEYFDSSEEVWFWEIKK